LILRRFEVCNPRRFEITRSGQERILETKVAQNRSVEGVEKSMADKSGGGKVMVLHSASILTMDDEQRVYLDDGAVVVVDDKISAIGKTKDVLEAYKNKADVEVHDLAGRWIIPGNKVFNPTLHQVPKSC